MSSKDKEQNEWRKGVTQVTKDGSWTVKKLIPLGLLIFGILIIGVWILKGSDIIKMDIERETIQHSRQYIEPRVAKMQNLYTEYTKLQTRSAEAEERGAMKVAKTIRAQQIAQIDQMRLEAGNIPAHEIPEKIKQLLER